MLSSALQNISDGVISEIGQVFSAIGLPERHGNELGRTGASALCAVVLLPHTGRTRSAVSLLAVCRTCLCRDLYFTQQERFDSLTP